MGQSHNALLEVMEQQRVSVAKAGIVCNLSARCSIVAAANPVGGHYDRGKTVAENLKMSAPLLSRFDLIFILLDRPDARHDERLASYIMSMHTSSSSSSSQRRNIQDENRNEEDSDDDDEEITSKSIERRLKRASSSKHIGADPLPPRLLRRYIAYARRYVRSVRAWSSRIYIFLLCFLFNHLTSLQYARRCQKHSNTNSLEYYYRYIQYSHPKPHRHCKSSTSP